jgi:hypothetical protein
MHAADYEGYIKIHNAYSIILDCYFARTVSNHYYSIYQNFSRHDALANVTAERFSTTIFVVVDDFCGHVTCVNSETHFGIK